MEKTRLLEQITTPHQLRRLDESQLEQLAEELRQRIIDVVSRHGGHLASNLGTAELTIALHYVFDFSTDRLLWDVGHQCYAHKILTGRAGMFDTLRQAGGLSGFPAPTESPYDLFATGHAGTAISTAHGLAWGDLAARRDTKVVAVVGDASIVNGLSLEGINNAALLPRQFLIILNDNSMAIDRTRGALASTLDRVRMTSTYDGLRRHTEKLLQRVPLGGGMNEAIRHVKDGLKTAIRGPRIFETLGFGYFGPIDGHNVHDLIRVLRRLKDFNRPALLHVHTVKGRGCEYAVEDPCRFHSPSAFTHDGHQAVFPVHTAKTWTEVFSTSLLKLAEKDERIVAITAAMADGTGLASFAKKFPSRFIDVGINESHAVAMAGGLAKAGMKPVVAIYSTFMQRAYDQVFQEICLQGLTSVFCMDRAGLVGSDGPVHHGFADIALMRTLPGMVLMAPADAAEMDACLKFAFSAGSPCAIRYPRDEVDDLTSDDCPPFQLGKARVVRAGKDGCLLCYGTTVEPALEAADQLLKQDGLQVSVVSARFAKPLDVMLFSKLINSGKPLLICEDHAITGGFGSAVLEMAASRGLSTSNVRLLGIPDRFIAHGKRQQQLTEIGLDAANMADMFKQIARNPASLNKLKS